MVPQLISSKESACNARDTGDVGSIPGSSDPLEGGVATHSSILAWKIPWTEETGRLQSMGSQRVGHDSATKIHRVNLQCALVSGVHIVDLQCCVSFRC